jgi:two-component system LytT family response regulator
MLDVLQATGEAADRSTAHSAGDGAAASAPGRAPALTTDTKPDGAPGRIAVQRSGVTELVPIKDVHFFEADGSYVKVHTKAHTYLIRERMKRLDARLPERHFCRIHRSTIVRLSDVEALEPTEQGDVAVRLSNGTRLRVSRGRRETLEDRLGLL